MNFVVVMLICGNGNIEKFYAVCGDIRCMDLFIGFNINAIVNAIVKLNI